MTRSIYRKTGTGFTAKLNGTQITLDGDNVRVRVEDREAYLTKSDFFRMIRLFEQHILSEPGNVDTYGWEADERVINPPLTPLYVNGVKRTRELLAEAEKTPRYFRDQPSADVKGDVIIYDQSEAL